MGADTCHKFDLVRSMNTNNNSMQWVNEKQDPRSDFVLISGICTLSYYVKNYHWKLLRMSWRICLRQNTSQNLMQWVGFGRFSYMSPALDYVRSTKHLGDISGWRLVWSQRVFFQKTMSQTVEVITDAKGLTVQEHDQRLRTVLQCAKQKIIIWSSTEKSVKWEKTEVKYVGLVLT